MGVFYSLHWRQRGPGTIRAVSESWPFLPLALPSSPLQPCPPWSFADRTLVVTGMMTSTASAEHRGYSVTFCRSMHQSSQRTQVSGRDWALRSTAAQPMVPAHSHPGHGWEGILSTLNCVRNTEASAGPTGHTEHSSQCPMTTGSCGPGDGLGLGLAKIPAEGLGSQRPKNSQDKGL